MSNQTGEIALPAPVAAYEKWKGEGLKTLAEDTLHFLGSSAVGRQLIETYAFGPHGRIEDAALHTTLAGIEFENPVMVGAGWDKKGRAVAGLYALGFSGVEVGSVLAEPQPGNDKPRLWTIDEHHGVGFNRLGFNSLGMRAVKENLHETWPVPCPVGISLGKNKLCPDSDAPAAHAMVAARLYEQADYFVVNVSSPNTPGLRGLQAKGPLTDIVQAVQETLRHCGGPKPLFVKIAPELTDSETDDVIGVALTWGAAGIIAVNTTTSEDIRRAYGERWAREAGGLSGADPRFHRMAVQKAQYIYEQAGDKLEVIGVGGVGDRHSALDMLGAGASIVQVVTAIRPSKGKVAARINRGLREYMGREGVSSIKELIGVDTKRGVKAA